MKKSKYVKKQNGTKLNFNLQVYRTIPIRLIDRYYGNKNAMRYTINETNQNVWIPKKHLYTDGTIKAVSYTHLIYNDIRFT